MLRCQESEKEKPATYREDEAVLEVGKLFVALLAAEHPVLLVHHFFVAVLAGAGLVKAVLLAQVHDRCDAGVVVGLQRRQQPQALIFVHAPSVGLQSERQEDNITIFYRGYTSGILMQPRQNPNGCVNIPVNKRAATSPRTVLRKHSKSTQKSPEQATGNGAQTLVWVCSHEDTKYPGSSRVIRASHLSPLTTRF